ncbi:hypothetical protein Tco_1551963, partial [Tanacetum coccineum]
YKALVEAYKSDKLILDTYGDTVLFKRRRYGKDKDEEPSAGSNRRSQRRRIRKEPELTKEPIHTAKDLEEPAHQEFDTRATEDQPVDETPQPSKWFQIPTRLPSPDRDWNNPEGQQYPHDLRKPLPLIPNSRGRKVIPFDHFINNDLAYLSGGVSSQTYATSVTKTKAADYGRRLQEASPSRHRRYDDPSCLRKADKSQCGRSSSFWCLSEDVYKKDAYTAYSNPRGFIYQNKDKKNKLIRIDELHKFSDGTLDDVRSALNDRLKGIRMEYLPQTIWRQSDRERAKAMIVTPSNLST